jgi:hypothetical protein
METVLVCNVCRAEIRLVGPRANQYVDVMTFCNAHRPHAEGVGFSLLLPLSQPRDRERAAGTLQAGATVGGLTSEERPLTVHAALPDMSSLCGQYSPQTLLPMFDLSWNEIPSDSRCADCDTLS